MNKQVVVISSKPEFVPVTALQAWTSVFGMITTFAVVASAFILFG